jgi:hypothetical protein
MRSVQDGVDAILLTMHNEDFEAADNSGKKSSYMKELQVGQTILCFRFAIWC